MKKQNSKPGFYCLSQQAAQISTSNNSPEKVYYDSFEVYYSYSKSVLKENLREIKREIKARLKNNHLFFGLPDFMHYSRQINEIKLLILELNSVDFVKKLNALNAKYKPKNFYTLTHISKN